MTTTEKNQIIRKAVSTIFDARAELYTLATDTCDKAIYGAIYGAIDAMSAEIKKLEGMISFEPSAMHKELLAELGITA